MTVIATIQATSTIRPAGCLGLGNCYLGFTYSVATSRQGKVTRATTHWYCRACAKRWDVEEEVTPCPT